MQPLAGAQAIPAERFDVFPLEAASSEGALHDLAGLFNKTVNQNKIETHSWVYDLTLASLPLASQSDLRAPDPEIRFDHWLYEHGAKSIYRYIKR